jgi:CNT family concentrative nucleoside transporter
MLIVLAALVYLVNAFLGACPRWRAPAHPAAHLRLAFRAARVDHGRCLERGTGRRRAARHEDRAQRIHRVPGARQVPDETSRQRSKLLMTYALCGFANFGSLGILIGGMGAMVPERRGEIVVARHQVDRAGTLATCMTAAVVGIFL